MLAVYFWAWGLPVSVIPACSETVGQSGFFVRQRVMGTQLSKDSATRFTISGIREYVFPFHVLINH